MASPPRTAAADGGGYFAQFEAAGSVSAFIQGIERDGRVESGALRFCVELVQQGKVTGRALRETVTFLARRVDELGRTEALRLSDWLIEPLVSGSALDLPGDGVVAAL